MKLANVKIGRKLALVLGACTFLLVSLAALALWGNRTIIQDQQVARDRLTKELLAAQVTGGVSAAAFYVQTMASVKPTEAAKAELLQVRNEYRGALERFTAMADSETSKGQAADMQALVQQFVASDDKVLEAAFAGRQAEALKMFHENSLPVVRSLRAKAEEAERWQEKRATDSQQDSEATTSSVRLALILGCLVAVVLSLGGGIVLTRSIAYPLGLAVGASGSRSRAATSPSMCGAEFLARRRRNRPARAGPCKPCA